MSEVVVLALAAASLASACGVSSSSPTSTAPRTVKSTITRVEGTSTVIETVTGALSGNASTSSVASPDPRKVAFDTGFYNCQNLPTNLVRQAVRQPSFRPRFMRMVLASLSMSTNDINLRPALLGCLKALRPRVADAERAFAGRIPA